MDDPALKRGSRAAAVAIAVLAAWLLLACQSGERRPGIGGATGVTGPAERRVVARVAESGDMEGEWVYLSDLPWASGTTGWVAVANEDLPALDGSFRGGPLIIGGTLYEKGLGVYPRSEIVYALDGQYAHFASDIGLNDLPGAGEEGLGGVVFLVYLDGALAYDSGVVRRGQLPAPVNLATAGVRELRLVVTTAGSPSPDNLADWADARLLRPTGPIDEAEVAATLAPLREQLAGRQARRDKDRRTLDRLAAAEAESLAALPPPANATPATIVTPHPTRKALVLWNGALAVSYGFGGEDHGQITVLHAPSGRLILYRADASVDIAPGLRLSLHHDTVPGEGNYAVGDVDDPVFGPGRRLDLPLQSKDRRIDLTMSLTLYDGGAYYVQQIAVNRSPAPARGARIRHVESLGPSALALGDGLRYLTDASRLRSAAVPDDGLRRRETVDQGKPVFLTGEGSGLGLLMAALDETTSTTELLTQVDSGRVMGRLALVTGPARFPVAPAPAVAGPRLYVEVTPTTQPLAAFQNFRRFVLKLYPPMPLPDWVRYQWLSWYVYYMDIDEASIRRQIDYIADNLGDLGPWHIIVDAGWYVAEGRPGADWRNVDRAKFPSGLRALVDYAHSKNVRVVLYFSAPYLDSRVQPGDWLGLRGLIEQHPDWLIPIGEDETHQSFIYNFDNPALRGYLGQVMHDFFVTYDVDGIKIDGLGNAEGAVLTPGQRDAFGLASRLRQLTMGIYRFVHEWGTSLEKDVYIESGWQTPLFANPLAHTFRYGDEAMAFSSRYPFPGLVEHVDYAIAQQALWGQRSNMGAVYGDPNGDVINEQWLQAALALGAQSVLSFDLPAVSAEALSRYRSLLVHYRPFAGATYYGTTPGVDSFATTVDGLTYLGILNRGEEPREVELPLADYGLAGEESYAVYDLEKEEFYLTRGSVRVMLEPSSLRLLLLRSATGVMWTNSSYSVDRTAPGVLSLVVRGPAQLDGFVQLFVPGLEAVALDGRRLSAGRETDGASYDYDAANGIVTLHYRHDRPHQIELHFRY